jgi:hypothetical protein
MADLSISSSSGTQTSTQSPQGLVSSGNNAAAESGGNVQPGTATTLLTTSSGISLHPTALTTVNVGAAGSEPVAGTSPAVATVNIQPKHHINGGLLGISIGLLVVAAIVFLFITRSAKNTTNYH